MIYIFNAVKNAIDPFGGFKKKIAWLAIILVLLDYSANLSLTFLQYIAVFTRNNYERVFKITNHIRGAV